jgi:hypothetical protein
VEFPERDLTRIRVLSSGLGITFSFTSGTEILLQVSSSNSTTLFRLPKLRFVQ